MTATRARLRAARAATPPDGSRPKPKPPVCAWPPVVPFVWHWQETADGWRIVVRMTATGRQVTSTFLTQRQPRNDARIAARLYRLTTTRRLATLFGGGE